jgi:hypothetical protein
MAVSLQLKANNVFGWVTLLLHIPEIKVSYLRQETGYFY